LSKQDDWCVEQDGRCVLRLLACPSRGPAGAGFVLAARGGRGGGQAALCLAVLHATTYRLCTADLIVRYAELLAANGRLGTALDYLGMLPGGPANPLQAAASAAIARGEPQGVEAHPIIACHPPSAAWPSDRPPCCVAPNPAGEPTTAVAVLKERLYSAAAASGQLPPGVAPPPFPFAGGELAAPEPATLLGPSLPASSLPVSSSVLGILPSLNSWHAPSHLDPPTGPL
jgi:hypothetical protein